MSHFLLWFDLFESQALFYRMGIQWGADSIVVELTGVGQVQIAGGVGMFEFWGIGRSG